MTELIIFFSEQETKAVMDTDMKDKNPTIKSLISSEMDGAESDSSMSMYYSTVETDTSNTYQDESTLDADEHSSSLSDASSLEKTVKQTNTPLVRGSIGKSVACSPMVSHGSGKKILYKLNKMVSSTPHLTPQQGRENDLNLSNRRKMMKVTEESTIINTESKHVNLEIVNQKLEAIKLDLPEKANWRFTSPSNVAYTVPEKDTTPSPGQLQFEKVSNHIGQEFEDLNCVLPPDTGRPSMMIQDFEAVIPIAQIKTPNKKKSEAALEELEIADSADSNDSLNVSSPKELFERLASEMENANMADMMTQKPSSLFTKRTSISTVYRHNTVEKSDSMPVPTRIPAVAKRATWALNRAVHISLPEAQETKPSSGLKKWSPKIDLPSTSRFNAVGSRRSYMPTLSKPELKPLTNRFPAVKDRQSLFQTGLAPSAPKLNDSAKKRKCTTLKIATVNIGNRRSSFGMPIIKTQSRRLVNDILINRRNSGAVIKFYSLHRSVMPKSVPSSVGSTSTTRRSVLPTIGLPRPIRKSMIPNSFESATGAIPKQLQPKMSLKSDTQCKYCDKKFAIIKALDDHLILKCTKIPPNEKKKLLSQERAQREIEVIRKPHSATGNYYNVDMAEASCSSQGSAKVSSMPPPKSAAPRAKSSAKKEHSGLTRTPTKLIPCKPCGLKFLNPADYSKHVTSIHMHNPLQ